MSRTTLITLMFAAHLLIKNDGLRLDSSVRRGPSPVAVTTGPRGAKDTTACPETLKHPDAFWVKPAVHFADNFHELFNRAGRKVNNRSCSASKTKFHLHNRSGQIEPNWNCNFAPTQRDRFQAVERVLAGTSELFHALNVTYFLGSGTLIGEWRCQDILPWSEDADVNVPRNEMESAIRLIFGKERAAVLDNEMVAHEDNPLVPPGVVVWRWSNKKAHPLGIGDRATGFYVDVWQSDHVEGDVVQYWPHADHTCPESPDFPGMTRCFRWPRALVYPLRDCEVRGVRHSCPGDTINYLKRQYGNSVLHPPSQYNEVLAEIFAVPSRAPWH